MNRIVYNYFISFIFCAFLAWMPHQASAYDKVNLIWQIEDSFWETDWIREVLSDVDYDDVKDGKYEILCDRSIIVVSAPSKASKAYFAKLRRLKYKFGIIHLSDSRYAHKASFYANAQFILRNHWHKKFLINPKIHFFPLGYKRGFWEQEMSIAIPDCSHRNYTWSFAGQIVGKPTRKQMVEQMKLLSPYFIYETFQWDDKNSLPITDYRQLMLDTIFIPCPTGWWNLDSFRVYEALECGCIPIVEKQPLDYFGKFFHDHPFIVVDSWDQAVEQIDALLSHPDEMERRRQQCYTWWQNYKIAMKAKVKDLTRKLESPRY